MCTLRSNKRANLGHDSEQSDRANVRALASHVRTRDDHAARTVSLAQLYIIGNKLNSIKDLRKGGGWFSMSALTTTTVRRSCSLLPTNEPLHTGGVPL